MDLVPSPLLPAQLRAAKWRKSRHSNPSGNCVEMARLPGEQVAVRASHRPDGPALLFSRAAWERFLCGVREGTAELALPGPRPTSGDRSAGRVAPGDPHAAAELRRSLEQQGVNLLGLDIGQHAGTGGAGAHDDEREWESSNARSGDANDEETSSEATLRLPDGVLVDVLA